MRRFLFLIIWAVWLSAHAASVSFQSFDPAYFTTNNNIIRATGIGATNISGGTFSNVTLTAASSVTTAKIANTLISGTNYVVTQPQLHIYYLTNFGCAGDGRRVIRAKIAASGTAVIVTNAAFTAADVGRWINIPRANTNNLTSLAQITAVVNTTNITIDPAVPIGATNVTVYIATDDTAAYQAALDFCTNFPAGSGVVLEHGGLSYGIAAAVSGVGHEQSNYNSQIHLPPFPIANRGHQVTTIVFHGPFTVADGVVDTANVENQSTDAGEVVFMLPRGPDGTNRWVCLQSQNFITPMIQMQKTTGGVLINYNAVGVVIDGVRFRMNWDNNMVVLDLQGAAFASLIDTSVEPGYFPGAISPLGLTGTNGWGIRMPASFAHAMSAGGKARVGDAYNLFETDGNVTMDFLYLYNGINALCVNAASGLADSFQNVLVQESSNTVACMFGEQSYVFANISAMNIVHFTNGLNNLIYDPGNALAGRIEYSTFPGNLTPNIVGNASQPLELIQYNTPQTIQRTATFNTSTTASFWQGGATFGSPVSFTNAGASAAVVTLDTQNEAAALMFRTDPSGHTWRLMKNVTPTDYLALLLDGTDIMDWYLTGETFFFNGKIGGGYPAGQIPLQLFSGFSTTAATFTNSVTLKSFTPGPAVSGTDGVLWNSNSVLHWVTATSTNKLAGP